ncbi:unnamed protein product [Lepidochelys kempii]
MKASKGRGQIREAQSLPIPTAIRVSSPTAVQYCVGHSIPDLIDRRGFIQPDAGTPSSPKSEIPSFGSKTDTSMYVQGTKALLRTWIIPETAAITTACASPRRGYTTAPRSLPWQERGESRCAGGKAFPNPRVVLARSSVPWVGSIKP